MKIKITTQVPARAEVDGTKFAVSPLWYSTGYSAEGVIGAVHRSATSSIEYFILSQPFERQADLNAAYFSGFTVIYEERAQRIAEALIRAGQAQAMPEE